MVEGGFATCWKETEGDRLSVLLHRYLVCQAAAGLALIHWPWYISGRKEESSGPCSTGVGVLRYSK